jgi:acyl-CoA reductase-like NAD-dependent aldehyde dehydrogenase
VAAARKAQGPWAARTAYNRGQILYRAAEALESRTDQLAAVSDRGQVQDAVDVLVHYAGWTDKLHAVLGGVNPVAAPFLSFSVPEPTGVVGVVAPDGPALLGLVAELAPALAAGNTVVLKPSELSPVVGGLIWGEIFAEAGLPAGVLNVVTHAPGDAAPIGDEMVENPAVRRINFTGSTATGRRLAEAAGRHLKRVVLELGGYNPLLVLADADLDYAVNAAAFGAFLHQGQICMSARRVIVERSVADEFVERLAAKASGLKAGDPKEPDTIIGPLITADALATVKGRVDDAVARGARVLAGGEADGPCYRATVIADVPEDSELARLETFGPVLAVEVVDGADEAVARANATSYGLAGGIITSDADRGLALAQRLESGIVHVNDQPVGDEPQMPFGGVKDSGWGRFGGQAVVDEFTELHWITVQSGSHPYPF